MNVKSCHDYNEAIGALVDGPIDAAARADVEEHLRQCAGCRALVADLRRIRVEAASLPPVPPPLTLWPRISARLKSAGVGERAVTRAATADGANTAPGAVAPSRSHGVLGAISGWFSASPFRAAAAAGIAMLVLAAGTTVLVLRLASTPPGGSTSAGAAATGAAGAPADTAHANAADLVQSVEDELRMAEQHYEKAIAGLEQITKTEQANLDPAVAETLQKNLGIIDQAIRDSRAALVQQPTSQLAQESLFEAFRRKVGLLQDTVALINEMRKGNQAGAARIIEKVNQS